MKRRFRLTRSKDFSRVRHTGKSYAHPLLVLIATPSDNPNLRVGIAAGKTVGGAIRRNRAKRLLRAAIQPLLPRLSSGWDLILIARPGIIQTQTNEVQQVLEVLLQRAKLIENMYV